jgi:hypothetical protein
MWPESSQQQQQQQHASPTVIHAWSAHGELPPQLPLPPHCCHRPSLLTEPGVEAGRDLAAAAAEAWSGRHCQNHLLSRTQDEPAGQVACVTQTERAAAAGMSGSLSACKPWLPYSYQLLSIILQCSLSLPSILNSQRQLILLHALTVVHVASEQGELNPQLPTPPHRNHNPRVFACAAWPVGCPECADASSSLAPTDLGVTSVCAGLHWEYHSSMRTQV